MKPLVDELARLRNANYWLRRIVGDYDGAFAYDNVCPWCGEKPKCELFGARPGKYVVWCDNDACAVQWDCCGGSRQEALDLFETRWHGGAE
jgi:hypothetical protein